MPVKKPMTAGNRFKGRFKTVRRWISSKKLLFLMLQKGYKSLENFLGYSKMATLLGWRSRRGYNWVLTDRVEVLLCGGRRRGDSARLAKCWGGEAPGSMAVHFGLKRARYFCPLVYSEPPSQAKGVAVSHIKQRRSFQRIAAALPRLTAL